MNIGKALHITREEYEELCRKLKKQPEPPKSTGMNSCDGGSAHAQVASLSKPKMTKTELEYERIYLRDKPHKFQPLTFRMANGLKYTPDYYVPEDLLFIEVKGSYRLPSHGRSILAYNQCRVEFPEFRWQLATKTKEGWIIK